MNDNNQSSDRASDTPKRGAYPYYSLEKSLEVAAIVANLGGNTGDVAKGFIAQKMGVEEESAVLMQTVSAAKCFGIIDGRRALSLTVAGKKYFMPTSDNDRHEAKFAFVSTPTVFEKLLAKYDGATLPSNEMIANLIHREYGVPNSWKQRIASLFVSSLRYVGAIDAQGIVRFGAMRNSPGRTQQKVTLEPKEAERSHNNVPAHRSPTQEPVSNSTISFPIGPDRFLTVPKDLTDEDCEIIETMLPALQAYARRGLAKQVHQSERERREQRDALAAISGGNQLGSEQK